MKQLTKIQASLLYGYGYKLIDRKGVVYDIDSAYSESLYITNEHRLGESILFNQIGKDYFILCRPYEQLTKEIEPNFIPLNYLNELNGSLAAYSHDYPVNSLPNWMTEKLYQWHFKPHSIEESHCKFIEL